MYHLLLYTLVPDYLDRRPAHRDQHLAQARQAHEEGELVMAGALADPVDTALLVFRSNAAAERFAQADPYVRNGLVTDWRVRPWTVVIGGDATP
jgi:uncharacterized protein YciI